MLTFRKYDPKNSIYLKYLFFQQMKYVALISAVLVFRPIKNATNIQMPFLSQKHLNCFFFIRFEKIVFIHASI